MYLFDLVKRNPYFVTFVYMVDYTLLKIELRNININAAYEECISNNVNVNRSIDITVV